MPRFTTKNTEGYTQAQLDELNERFEDRMRRVHPDASDDARKSLEDFHAERALADFDREQAA